MSFLKPGNDNGDGLSDSQDSSVDNGKCIDDNNDESDGDGDGDCGGNRNGHGSAQGNKKGNCTQ